MTYWGLYSQRTKSWYEEQSRSNYDEFISRIIYYPARSIAEAHLTNLRNNLQVEYMQWEVREFTDTKQREAVTMSESIICPRCKQRVEVLEGRYAVVIQPHQWATARGSEYCPASSLPIRGNWRDDPTYKSDEPPTRELLVELDGEGK